MNPQANPSAHPKSNQRGRHKKKPEEVIFKRYMINTTEAEAGQIEKLFALKLVIKSGSRSEFLKTILLTKLHSAKGGQLEASLGREAQAGSLTPLFLVKISAFQNTLRGIVTNYNQSLKRLHTLVVPAHIQEEVTRHEKILSEIRSLLGQVQQLLPAMSEKDDDEFLT